MDTPVKSNSISISNQKNMAGLCIQRAVSLYYPGKKMTAPCEAVIVIKKFGD